MKKQLTLKLVYGGVLIALGVLFPQLFHVFGPQAGQTLLPMHIPVLLAGLLIGPYWGMAVGIIAPILSSLMTGMPAIPMLYFMLFELVTYAVVAGLLSSRNINVYLILIITLVCGRLVNGAAMAVAVNIFGLSFPFANITAFFGGVVKGLPGIVIQLVLIPPIIFALKKGGLTLAYKSKVA